MWRLLDRLDEPELAAIASARAAAAWEIVWAQRAEVAGDCIRLRVLRIHSQLNQKTAIQFLDYLLERLPFRVEVIQTTALSSAPAPLARPRHRHRPQLHQAAHPAAERQGGTLPPHRRRRIPRMLDGVVIDDAKIFNDKFREWEDFHNYHRPHGALDGHTPYERLRQRTTRA